MTESAALLRAEGLSKSFGGLTATDSLTLEVRPGELHAVIGPNGAGKTTLIGQLAGEIAPDSGRVLFAGKDISRLPLPDRARQGLVRSFQVTSIFSGFTAADNVALAVQANAGHSFRFWRDARRDPALREPALAALEQVGLSGRAEIQAASLSHGEQRQLEVAMALATGPTLLLLDEPLAGMGPEESASMVTLLKGLKGTLSILLVEHDMDAIFALADRITVLVYGRAIASGTPAEIRADAAVQDAYLGAGDEPGGRS